MKKIIILLGIIILGSVIVIGNRKNTSITVPIATTASSTVSATPETPKTLKTAVLGNGCFWCAEADMEKEDGVIKVISGYSGGTGDNPTYENYASGKYREVVEVTYDSTKTSFAKLVLNVLQHGDPTDPLGSFYDRGIEYAPAIYYDTEEEKEVALRIIAKVDAKKIFPKPINIFVGKRQKFYSAEEYHQDYYKKNPLKYRYYRTSSGRDAFIEKYWDNNPTINTEIVDEKWKSYIKPPKEELKKILTPFQYEITQKNGTETPFSNEYDKNKAEGIYVDVLSGEPLFSSTDKYDSGTGWPSFVKPISPNAVTLHEDKRFFSTRTEVRSRYADNHLGHVFDDGLADRGGKRYCMNSAALRFVPKDQMLGEGYGEYLGLFI